MVKCSASGDTLTDSNVVPLVGGTDGTDEGVLVVAESTILAVAAHEAKRSALAKRVTKTLVVGPLVLKSKFISGGQRVRGN